MASMREIKLRIKSIKQTRQITKALKLISAAKLKKARQQLEQTLPYFDKVKVTMADILQHSGNIESKFFDIRDKTEGRKKGYLVITGDMTLAGGYNHNLIKLAESKIKDKDSILFVAGHTGRNYFTKHGYNVDQNFDYSVQNPTTYRAQDITDIVLERYIKGELDEVYVIFTMAVSSLKQEPQLMKLLPLELESLKEELKSVGGVTRDFSETVIDESLTYEPSPEAVFDVLIPKYVKGIIYGALVESFTSEQSARMTAMDNATNNADDMLNRLNLFYNRARQAAITQEISEIVGGASALQ